MNNKEINNKFFRKLIERYLDGLTTADELKLLVNYYESFQKENEWVEALGSENIIKKRMLVNILEAIKEEDNVEIKVIPFYKKRIFQQAVAASVLLLVGLTFVFNSSKGTTSISNEPVIIDNNIKIGSTKATLRLEDGSVLSLEDSAVKKSNLYSDGKKLVYTVNNNAKKDIAYNYLTVPTGGEYQLEMSDGTKVWLNSETQLKYPVAFLEGAPRKVELLYGEAYFEVSPSTKHNGAKFIVASDTQEIEVLGTEFNLKAYKNEASTETTLVHGKVRVDYQGKPYFLLPNEQITIDNVTSAVDLKTVDAYFETSWRTGNFKFQDKSLKDIMKVLSRWYDFKFVFKTKQLENEEFMGSLGKNQNIVDILYSLKDIGVIENFKIEDKTITIE